MNLKKIIIICLVLTIFSIILANTSIYANGLGTGFDYSVVPKDGEIIFVNQTNKIWNTVIAVVRMLTFLGIFIVGLRYMFSSPNQKGELKKSSIVLIIGMVFVFASTLVIEFVVKIFGELV